MKKFIKENKIYLITMVFIFLVFNIRLPYYVNAPGGVIDISDRIEYKEKIEYDGSLNMLYVTEYIATIPTYLMTYISDNWDLEDIKDSQISNESTEEINLRNKIMLDNSINNAKYIAYKTADKKVEIINKKHIVIGTISDTNLQIGDEILEINNKKIEELSEIKDFINSKEIGDELEIKVVRDKKTINITESIKEQDGVKVLGVVIMTDFELDTSDEVKLKFKKSESGSSGGLMMALSIYSAISESDILKGRNIAGTGTIDINGNVGEISGVKYKIMGAAKNDIDIVFVPSANYKEAIKTKKDNNYKLDIVSVDTFLDAINYLEDVS